MRSTGWLAPILIVAALTGGCATPTREYVGLYEAGNRADVAGDYARARDAYQRALDVARANEMDLAYVSAATYNLGRMIGYLCDYVAAERLLKEALALERSRRVPAGSSAWFAHRSFLNKRLGTLAMLSYDQGKFTDAVAYYEQLLLAAEEMGIAREDPIALASAFDDFANALDEANLPARAATARGRAQDLRNRHPDGLPRGNRIVPFREVCGAR